MVKRILCSEAEVDSMKVRTGDLDSEDWIKLGKASGEGFYKYGNIIEKENKK